MRGLSTSELVPDGVAVLCSFFNSRFMHNRLILNNENILLRYVHPVQRQLAASAVYNTSKYSHRDLGGGPACSVVQLL